MKAPGHSIRNRILLVVLLIFLTLALCLGAGLFYEAKILKQDLIDRTRTAAQFIGEYAAIDLQSGNKEALKNSLQRSQSLLSIEAVYVFDAKGNLFLAYPKTLSDSTPYGWLSPRVEFGDDALHLVQPILRDDRTLGSVYLRVSTQQLNNRIQKYSVILFSFLAITLGMSVLFVWRLQRAISLPILRLADTMKEIPESAALTIEPKEQHRDEIGDLYSGFNKMLRKIERREVQRDRAETALSESERRYRNLVESSPDAIFLQQNDKIIYMNPSGLRLLGFSSEANIVGTDIFSFLPEAKSNPSQTFETTFLRPDGKRMDVDVTRIEISHEGASAIQGIVRDITERKQLREMSERMKRLAAIGELSAQIAHEIRNSIGSLQLNLRNLSDHVETPATREKAIASMQLGIQRMEETVSGILNFAKPNPPLMKKLSVRMVLESALKAVEKELEVDHIRVIRNYDDSCPDLHVDANQMQRAFINLFRNARQAMPSGGTLSLATKSADRFVEIELADTGEGIAAPDLEKIFDPFFTTRSDGTGLGLSIVARTLEQHGASVFVESAPGTGTKFHIRFPV